MKIKFNELKEFIADHGRYILAVFFFVPMIISQCAIWIGVTDIGFVSPWETSYREAFGGAEGYSFTVVMYWVMSPLVFLWIHSKANDQGMSLKKAIIVIPAIWLLSIACGIIVYDVGPASTLQHPSTRLLGILIFGKWHLGFCILYGGIFYTFCFTIYIASYLTFRLISNRLKKE
ncbi:hypothetical protein AF72_08815 [Xylella taiwanensis]|uniref:Uncharacterized protein n=1 Tax=Xylella taiwanensis TaxID=1444770 RepID=Z9JHJ1_9GAMM|nr:hypothetical protein AF72_08815 [Xylella taiwanensis]